MMKDLVASKNKYVKITMYILIAIAVLAVIIVIIKIIKAYQTGANAAGDIIGSQIVAAQTGVSSDRQVYLKTLVDNIKTGIGYSSILGYNYFGSINDDTVVNNLNELVNANEAALFSSYFKESTGFSIMNVINSWHFYGKDKINSTILSSLK